MVQNCAISTYGVSAGLPPNHPNNKQLFKNNQNNIFANGLNWELRICEFIKNGITIKIIIENNIKITPDNLCGTQRKMA